MKITSKTPFDILLDQYSEEAYNTFVILKTVANYPDVDCGDYTDEEGKLYATAVALLFSRYLAITIEMYENEDFSELIHKMDFHPEDAELIKIAQDFKVELDDFEESLHELLQAIKAKVLDDMLEIFREEEHIIKLFASIFKYEDNQEPSYIQSISSIEEML